MSCSSAEHAEKRTDLRIVDFSNQMLSGYLARVVSQAYSTRLYNGRVAARDLNTADNWIMDTRTQLPRLHDIDTLPSCKYSLFAFIRPFSHLVGRQCGAVQSMADFIPLTALPNFLHQLCCTHLKTTAFGFCLPHWRMPLRFPHDQTRISLPARLPRANSDPVLRLCISLLRSSVIRMERLYLIRDIGPHILLAGSLVSLFLLLTLNSSITMHLCSQWCHCLRNCFPSIVGEQVLPLHATLCPRMAIMNHDIYSLRMQHIPPPHLDYLRFQGQQLQHFPPLKCHKSFSQWHRTLYQHHRNVLAVREQGLPSTSSVPKYIGTQKHLLTLSIV